MVKISQGHIRSWVIPLPPISEQMSIANVTNSRLERITRLREVVLDAIKLLEEHRTALISAVVTGKTDVVETTGGLLDHGPQSG